MKKSAVEKAAVSAAATLPRLCATFKPTTIARVAIVVSRNACVVVLFEPKLCEIASWPRTQPHAPSKRVTDPITISNVGVEMTKKPWGRAREANRKRNIYIQYHRYR